MCSLMNVLGGAFAPRLGSDPRRRPSSSPRGGFDAGRCGRAVRRARRVTVSAREWSRTGCPRRARRRAASDRRDAAPSFGPPSAPDAGARHVACVPIPAPEREHRPGRYQRSVTAGRRGPRAPVPAAVLPGPRPPPKAVAPVGTQRARPRRRAAGSPGALSDSMPPLIGRGAGAVPPRRPRSPATRARAPSPGRGRRKDAAVARPPGAVPPIEPPLPPRSQWPGEQRAAAKGGAPRWRPTAVARDGATWLILPVVICLSQRLSHACASMN